MPRQDVTKRVPRWMDLGDGLRRHFEYGFGQHLQDGVPRRAGDEQMKLQVVEARQLFVLDGRAHLSDLLFEFTKLIWSGSLCREASCLWLEDQTHLRNLMDGHLAELKQDLEGFSRWPMVHIGNKDAAHGSFFDANQAFRLQRAQGFAHRCAAGFE